MKMYMSAYYVKEPYQKITGSLRAQKRAEEEAETSQQFFGSIRTA